MKKLALLAFIALVAVGLWWWESPRLAVENLLDAARDSDVAELEELIDAQRFDASLRAELGPRQAIGATRPPRTVPPMPTPSPSARQSTDRLLSGLAGDVELIQLRQAARTSWEIERRGLNSFRLERRSGEGKPLPALLFERDGLHWRLVGIDAPPMAASSDADGRAG